MIKPLDFLFYIIGLSGFVSIVISAILYFSWGVQISSTTKEDNQNDSVLFFIVGVGLISVVLILTGFK